MIKVFFPAAAAALAFMPTSASAASFQFSFTLSDGLSGAGTFVTHDTPALNGSYVITQITGTTAQPPLNITYPFMSAPNDFSNFASQLLYPNQDPLLDGLGITFRLSNGGNVLIRYVGDYYQAIRSPGNFVGVATSFVVTPPAAVPEPSTWAMMLIGFGGVGCAMRRRRQGFATSQLA